MAGQQARLFPQLRRDDPPAAEEAQDGATADTEEVPGRGQEGHRKKPPEQDRDSRVELAKEGLPLPVRRLPGQEEERGEAGAGGAH